MFCNSWCWESGVSYRTDNQHARDLNSLKYQCLGWGKILNWIKIVSVPFSNVSALIIKPNGFKGKVSVPGLIAPIFFSLLFRFSLVTKWKLTFSLIPEIISLGINLHAFFFNTKFIKSLFINRFYLKNGTLWRYVIFVYSHLGGFYSHSDPSKFPPIFTLCAFAVPLL